MEDEQYFQPILSSQEEDNFQQLNTVSIASIPLLLGVSLGICGIVFVSIWSEEQSKCDTYFIYLYLHCAYWLIVMTADHVVKARHHGLRMNGYLDFYQSTYQLIRTPLFIASLWNTCYLLLAVILHHTHKVDYERYCRKSEWFTPLNYIFLLTTLELAIIVPAYINYIKRVMRFNQLRPPPDVTRDEWLSPFTQDSYSGMGEIGYRQRGRNLEELLQKQADLIRYLRDHNVKLSHRILLLASERVATET
ncbi:PREDICTED: transmembrane protein 192 isoform X1 [Vollenhovia emeryi]|uniref:transmembrane protein 192 isoform X1 n=1 Tax=Vollenhovia emeryi TaxID=411798 RepID=UPI0005F4654E|nr:PREDICTED: transmembrane protein 192 isoform X1 [Vollenhovia emeryi]XP_011872235.1 PREDICTED: transmembrane protein 192 isoform X1 [Vollenhovia emeryi]XP_011872236.1 PREDICTED: transmembrane protein 192 isoform X1 [Vollenhovia emeryi]XP_011872237.1 PREDICTED: transmembrane protein 192 isoform X1 [Vollenhovia emeryi]